MKAKGSVIVVNWNGVDFLANCLDALIAQTYRSLEIILVDNGSADHSVNFVRERYGSRIRIIELPKNIGFAGGNNAGFKAAVGEYILLINNDAVADPAWARELIGAAEADETVGGCSSKILLSGAPGYLENTGLQLYPDGMSRGRAHLERDAGQYEISDEVAVSSGCACLYRREAVEKANAFDPLFFCYSDDAELGLKIRMAGWRHIYVPSAVAYHKGSGTTGSYSRMKAFLVERNRIWVMLKTYPLSAILMSPWYTLMRYLWSAISIARDTGAAGRFARQDSKWALIAIIIKAHLSAARHLPAILKDRGRIQKSRPPGPHPLKEWLGPRAMGVREFTQKD